MCLDDRKAFATSGVNPAAPASVTRKAVNRRAPLSVHMADALAHIFSLDVGETGGVLAPVGEPPPTHTAPLVCGPAGDRDRRPGPGGRPRQRRRRAAGRLGAPWRQA